MRFRGRHFTLSTLILAGSCLPGLPALADFYEHPWQNHHQAPHSLILAPELGFYFAPANFDSRGARTTPVGLVSFQRQTADLDLGLGLGPKLSAFGRLSLAMVEVKSTLLTGTTVSPGDQSFGLSYRLLDSGGRSSGSSLSVDLQVQSDIPAYSNATALSNGGPLPGDGTFDLSAGAFLTWSLSDSSESRLRLIAGGGYTWRSDRFSAQVPGSLKLDFEKPDSRFGLELGLQGFESLKTDSRGALGQLRPQDGSGGSQRVGAENPSLLDVAGAVRFAFSRTGAIRIGAQGTLWAENAPAGIRGTLGAVWNIDFAPSDDPLRLSPPAYGKANQGFIHYASDAKVVKSDRAHHLVRIDKGSQDGMEKGQVIDFFGLGKEGNPGDAIARGRVTDLGLRESTVQVEEYFKEAFIEEGFLARRPLE